MPGVLLAIGSAALGFAGLTLARRFVRSRRRPPPAGVPQLDLAALDVVMRRDDANALRQALAVAMGPRSPTLAHAAIVRALAERRAAWTHVAVRSWPVASADAIEARMRAVRDELRVRPSIEVPRGAPADEGGYRGERRASASTDEAYAMISLLVLAGAELPEVSGPVDVRADALLARLEATPRSALETVEIHWVPDDPRQERPLGDLLALSPRLVAIGAPPGPAERRDQPGRTT